MPLYKDVSRDRRGGDDQGVRTHLDKAWHFIVRHELKVGLGLVFFILSAGLIVGLLAYQEKREAGLRERLWTGWKAKETAEQEAVFKGIVEEGKEGTSSYYATMGLGRIAFERGDYEAALTFFRRAQELGVGEPLFTILARHNEVAALEMLGRFDEALAILERLMADPDNRVKDRSLFVRARILEVKGEREKAMEAYRTLARGGDYLDSPFREEAEKRILWLVSETKKS